MIRIARKSIVFLAIVSLLAAYVTGLSIRNEASHKLIQESFPEIQVAEKGDGLYSLSKDGQRLSYLALHKGLGWGGPFSMAVVVTPDKRIHHVKVLNHTETPSYFDHLIKRKFFDQFKGLNIDTPIKERTDIDMISGATVSSVAFTKAARLASHNAGNNIFAMSIEEDHPELNITSSEIILLALFLLVIILRLKKYTKMRFPVMITSMVFVGFLVNRSISLSYFSALMLGYVPSFYEQPIWWILMGGTLLTALFLSMNVYCYWMCPFGVIQELINKFGGVKIRLSPGVDKGLRSLVYVFLWATLMITFITGNPAAASYEPFAALFSLRGIPAQWYLISLALVGSFFLPQFWCRLFCPVGAYLSLLIRYKKKLVANILQWSSKKSEA
jgi:uncharacterized protein with FMN-binding domain